MNRNVGNDGLTHAQHAGSAAELRCGSAQREAVMSPRSYLFVPADRPERIGKALQSGADAVIVDLENAVAPASKIQAREALGAWLESPAAGLVLVRINARKTPWHDEDLRLCARPAVHGIVVPKAEDAGALAGLGKAVLPLIETAAGFDAVRAIAATPGVQRLLFGSIDFQVDLGIEGDDDALLFFRSLLVLASRLAGLEAPVDGVTTALDDELAVSTDTARAPARLRHQAVHLPEAGHHGEPWLHARPAGNRRGTARAGRGRGRRSGGGGRQDGGRARGVACASATGSRPTSRVMPARQAPAHSSQSQSSSLLASYIPSPSLSRSILLCVADCGATSITPRLPDTLSSPSCG
jgi:citrate lyase subunit beta/citryl-CoA lyase